MVVSSPTLTRNDGAVGLGDLVGSGGVDVRRVRSAAGHVAGDRGVIAGLESDSAADVGGP